MGKEIELVEYMRSDALTIYCTKCVDEELCSLEKFTENHKGTNKTGQDLEQIKATLVNMMRRGALKRDFRPEGKYADRLYALPTISGNSLRLYCLRIDDGILIVGGGGVKHTRTYQESPELNECVETLQQIDKHLHKLEKGGKINVEKGDKEIQGIERITFKIE